MKRFIEGEDRSQSTLFPKRLDDYIAEDNPVWVVDARVSHIKNKITLIRARMKDMATLEPQIEASADGQISLTDPDARAIASLPALPDQIALHGRRVSADHALGE